MPKFHQLKVQEIRRETADCVSVVLEVPPALKEAYSFTQGQHLTIRAVVEGEELRRSYSICASPLEGELRIAIKKVPGGRFSAFANEQLRVGDRLEVMTPMGHFFTRLDPAHAKHYVAFAAGSGITPVISILKAVLQTEPKSRFTLFYGNRSVDSIIFREAIEGLKNIYLDRLSVHHVLSREKLSSPLFSGRITAEKCRAYCTSILDVSTVDEFFLCGPEAMTMAIRDDLLQQGVDRRRIHFELFTTAGVRKKQIQPKNGHDPSIEAQIAITLDGLSFEFPLASDGDTILEAALKGGIDLPFACKGGVCCTCKARLLEGEVEMEVNYALEPEEVDAGYILTCQSHPKTDRVVVNFDA